MRVSEKLTNVLLRDQIITKEDYEIYLFGLHELLIELPIIIVPAILSYFLNVFSDYIVFLFLLISIRPSIGGYHAKSRAGCIIKSVLLCCCAMGLIIYFRDKVFLNAIMAFLLGGIIIFISPVSNNVDTFDRKKIKKRICLMISVTLILMGLALGIKFYYGLTGIMAAFLVLVCLLIIQIIKNNYKCLRA